MDDCNVLLISNRVTQHRCAPVRPLQIRVEESVRDTKSPWVATPHPLRLPPPTIQIGQVRAHPPHHATRAAPSTGPPRGAATAARPRYVQSPRARAALPPYGQVRGEGGTALARPTVVHDGPYDACPPSSTTPPPRHSVLRQPPWQQPAAGGHQCRAGRARRRGERTSHAGPAPPQAPAVGACARSPRRWRPRGGRACLNASRRRGCDGVGDVGGVGHPPGRALPGR